MPPDDLSGVVEEHRQMPLSRRNGMRMGRLASSVLLTVALLLGARIGHAALEPFASGGLAPAPLPAFGAGLLLAVLLRSAPFAAVIAVVGAAAQALPVATALSGLLGAQAGSAAGHVLAARGYRIPLATRRRAFAGALSFELPLLFGGLALLALELGTGWISKGGEAAVARLGGESAGAAEGPLARVLDLAVSPVAELLEAQLDLPAGPRALVLGILSLLAIGFPLLAASDRGRRRRSERIEATVAAALDGGEDGEVVRRGAALVLLLPSPRTLGGYLLPLSAAGVLRPGVAVGLSAGIGAGALAPALVASLAGAPAGCSVAIAGLLAQLLGIAAFAVFGPGRRLVTASARLLARRMSSDPTAALVWTLLVGLLLPLLTFLIPHPETP